MARRPSPTRAAEPITLLNARRFPHPRFQLSDSRNRRRGTACGASGPLRRPRKGHKSQKCLRHRPWGPVWTLGSRLGPRCRQRLLVDRHEDEQRLGVNADRCRQLSSGSMSMFSVASSAARREETLVACDTRCRGWHAGRLGLPAQGPRAGRHRERSSCDPRAIRGGESWSLEVSDGQSTRSWNTQGRRL